MTYYSDEAFPALSDEQWARLQAYGSAQEVESGELLWGAGEATYDLILVDSGEAEVIRATTARAAEAVVAGFGAGQFVGELGLLTGQATYLSARVTKPGRLVNWPPSRPPRERRPVGLRTNHHLSNGGYHLRL